MIPYFSKLLVKQMNGYKMLSYDFINIGTVRSTKGKSDFYRAFFIFFGDL